MAITRQQVDQVAHLSRLALSEGERQKFASQLGAVLEYMEKLNELDTAGVEPMAHGLAGTQPARLDVPGRSLSVQEVLRNAPASAGGCFKVPRIIE